MADTNTIVELLGFYNNFHEPKPVWNRESTVLGLTISFMTLSWCCVILRLHTRIKIIFIPGWDDYLLLTYLLFGTINSICLCLLPQYGLGQHMLLLSQGQMAKFLQTHYVANASYCMATALIKISLILQYLRVYEDRKLRMLCYSVLAVTILWGMGFSILGWFNCNPQSAYWNWAAPYHSWGFASLIAKEFYTTYMIHATTNMTLDFLVLAMSLPLLLVRNAPRRGLLALLAVGTLVSGISTWRLAEIIEHQAATSPTFDPTWYGPSVLLLGNVEVSLASVCACVPVFWPVLTSRLDEIFVTREVNITSENRMFGEDVELHKTGSGNSRSGTISSQTRAQLRAQGQKSHYQDAYIRSQVVPGFVNNSINV